MCGSEVSDFQELGVLYLSNMTSAVVLYGGGERQEACPDTAADSGLVLGPDPRDLAGCCKTRV